MTVRMELVGDKKLVKTLKKLERNVQQKYARKALRGGAKVVADQVRQNARALSGGGGMMKAVARGIRVRAMRRSRKGIGFRVLTSEKSRLPMDAGSKWYPPAHIELGSKKRPATPYMRPAIKAKEQAAIAEIRRSLWEQIRGTK